MGVLFSYCDGRDVWCENAICRHSLTFMLPPRKGVVTVHFIAILLFPQFRITFHQKLDIGNGLLDIIGLSDTDHVFRNGFRRWHVHVDLVVATDVFDFRTSWADHAMEKLLRNVNFLMHESRMGNGMVMI